ncbi:unnamed protein product [Merluccius merluccius]
MNNVKPHLQLGFKSMSCPSSTTSFIHPRPDPVPDHTRPSPRTESIEEPGPPQSVSDVTGPDAPRPRALQNQPAGQLRAHLRLPLRVLAVFGGEITGIGKEGGGGFTVYIWVL